MNFEEKRKTMVNHLILERRIQSDKVKQAFLKTPRELFVPKHLENYAYADTPLEIGNGQTISAPHMVAIMCEELDIQKDQKILEIGAGSGYHAAVVSKIVGEKGHVYTIERFADLAKKAEENLKNAGIRNVTVEVGDGSKGLEKYQPYDIIYVTCAAPDIPKPLIDQVKDPGQLMIPVGGTICTLILLEKIQGKITKKNLGGCAFVPLVGEYGHQSL
jgi:protein-L-isoaspartate(D-aspartate) O-methyltransferase